MQNKLLEIKKKFFEDVNRYKKNYSLKFGMQLIFNLDFWPIILIRLEEVQQHLQGPLRLIFKIILLFIRPIIQAASGTRIFYGAQFGGGLLLHTSVGVVIASKVKIGNNCTILSQVAVAHKGDGGGLGAPQIGDNVKLMNGCKIIGTVTIGNNCIIGANAVVLKDVPDNCIVAGVPARIIKHIES